VNNKDILDDELGIVPRKFFEWFGTYCYATVDLMTQFTG
jgi:hypothetical protein